tara:strand:- start:281 stop:553 length:273 start_codon:yes stop_codon:yes gene_type:complete
VSRENTNSTAEIKKELTNMFQEAFRNQDELQTLSTTELCSLLGKSRWTIYRLVQDGKLKAQQDYANTKGSRLSFRRVDVDDYLNSITIGG